MSFMSITTTLVPLARSLATTSYLDPGTGSYALQLLLAGLFGGLFALKQSWQQLRCRFERIAAKDPVEATALEATD